MTTVADTKRSDVWLGCCLLGLAGMVDAVAFIVLKGTFVAFMSGNTTIAAASLAGGDWHFVWLTVLLLTLFVSGVVCGAAISRWGGDAAHRTAMVLITAVTAAGAAVANTVSETAGVIVIAFAAGLVNAVLASNTDVHVGLTFVTGTLVKASHQLVDGIGTVHPWRGSRRSGTGRCSRSVRRRVVWSMRGGTRSR